MTNDDFIRGWNELGRPERSHLRRMVRLGRPTGEPDLDALAPGYAQMQNSKPWMRLFWLWFVPGMFIALSVASTMHPLAVGIVIAFAAQAVWAHRNLKKTARLELAA